MSKVPDVNMIVALSSGVMPGLDIRISTAPPRNPCRTASRHSMAVQTPFLSVLPNTRKPRVPASCATRFATGSSRSARSASRRSSLHPV